MKDLRSVYMKIAKYWYECGQHGVLTGVGTKAEEALYEELKKAIRSKIPKKAIFGIAGVDEEPSIGIGRVQGYNQAILDLEEKLK